MVPDADYIETIVVGTSVTSLGVNAFSYTPGLVSVTIPSSVVSIGQDAFLECPSLERVVFLGRTIEDVQGMSWYDLWGIDESIIQAD